MADKTTVDKILATIRQRESGGNYTAKNASSSASGAYQYIDGTWKGWLKRVYPDLANTYPTAMSAPQEIQDAVARANVESILDSNGGRVDAVPRAWYTGNPNAPDSMQPAGAGNEGFTVGRYVAGWMSAYDGSTAGGGSVAGEAPPSDARTPEQYAMEEYGQYAAFLSHPEIGPILLRAAKEKWSEEILRGELIKTDWWKTTNESARRWMALESSDSVEAQSQVNGRAADIMARANQLGYPISRNRAEVIAKDSLKFNWQGAELDRAIGMDAGQQDLLRSSFGMSLKQVAASYAVPVDPATLGSWAKRIASGEETEENFVTWARDMAINMYPSVAAHISRGGTVEEFYAPYREIAAKTLQISPDQIDLSDTKWSAALSVPDATGERRPLRTDEWEKMLKSDDKYNYRYTKNARDEAEDFVGNLKRMFGEVA